MTKLIMMYTSPERDKLSRNAVEHWIHNYMIKGSKTATFLNENKNMARQLENTLSNVSDASVWWSRRYVLWIQTKKLKDFQNNRPKWCLKILLKLITSLAVSLLKPKGPFSQHFIFLKITNDLNKLECCINKARKACHGKHSSLLNQFISYEENEVLWIQLQELYSQNFISS